MKSYRVNEGITLLHLLKQKKYNEVFVILNICMVVECINEIAVSLVSSEVI